jgi:hypothetical protein
VGALHVVDGRIADETGAATDHQRGDYEREYPREPFPLYPKHAVPKTQQVRVDATLLPSGVIQSWPRSMENRLSNEFRSFSYGAA